jgi:ribonuclease P protein component
MLPKEARLPRNEFHARGYRTATTPCFLVKAKKNTSLKNRLGVVIGVSSVKNATKRNFWRRQIRSIFLKIPPIGFDLLIIFSPKAKLPTRQVFQKTLHTAITSLIQPL